MDEVTSSGFSLWMESSTSPGRSKRPRKRAQLRSIHFADDCSTTTSSCAKPLHTTYHVENWMNVVDKGDLWVNSKEILLNVLSIRAGGSLYQQQLPLVTSHQAYSDALQSSFLQCCCDPQDDNEQYCDRLDSDEGPAQPEMCQDLWNSHYETFNYQLLGQHRGIEAYCVPILAIARLSVRKNLIQTIVLINQVLRCHPHRDLLLGNILRPLTVPSKRFARMMGIVDERNAGNKTSIPADAISNPLLSANAIVA
jgi:hypothetical protein